MTGQRSHPSPLPSLFPLIRELFDRFRPRDFAVRLWDGSDLPADPGRPTHFTLTIRHPGALRSIFLRPGELSLGEAFVSGDLDVEGDLVTATGIADLFSTVKPGWSLRLRLLLRLFSLPLRKRPASPTPVKLSGRRHSPERDRKAVTYHYDQSNEFYALWLDRRMVYSCAYFSDPGETLDAAQERKLDYLCRKLRLVHGQNLLDIGCGWGSLVIHAAKHYGVKALGITLSRSQAEKANKRITKAGLSGRCRVEVSDYRELDMAGKFERLVSVGMVEHVGETMLRKYFEEAWKLLCPGGVFLNHGISWNPLDKGRPGMSFVQKYVFPDGQLVPIHQTLKAAEETGFEVRDLENLREHYALTLRHWVRRLEARHTEAVRIVGETTYRIWRLFMAGYAYGFEKGRMGVHQVLLLKRNQGGRGDLPLTRSDWYPPAEWGR